MVSGHDQPRRLVLILGDQLTPSNAALRAADPARDVVLMAEVADGADYIPHHKKKIAFVFSAMRHFASELEALGWTVDYVRLDDPDNTRSIVGETARAAARYGCAATVVTTPGEWRLLKALQDSELASRGALEVLEDDRFICSKAEFEDWRARRKSPRMEHFYRAMRRKTGLLMAGDKPVGGRWNFDSENRKPPKRGLQFTGPLRFTPDATTVEVLGLVVERFPARFGDLEPFWFGVTRGAAEAAFAHFLASALPRFGDYQDAMLRDERFLYHAVISLYLNVGLLDPLDLCRRAETAYRAGRFPLNAAEGFIRQIVGWREYVRGIYWGEMPGYVGRNFLAHDRPLPDFFWSGDTEMACLRACIDQTREEAYAHHIQRLMVTGNFAMLAGIDPKAVHEWYLAVYADAYEWVELPNTLGMSQFADGGLLASKPYAASGNYINKMSDYCKSCRFDVKQKTGPDACPFNYLYWDFLDRHHDKLGGNPRLGQPYLTWRRMDEVRRRATRHDAAVFLAALDAPAKTKSPAAA
tara:strand:+ start:5175 stop:6752 length:1578 start_codon:yes stop_codon:yes gene_type:complete